MSCRQEYFTIFQHTLCYDVMSNQFFVNTVLGYKKEPIYCHYYSKFSSDQNNCIRSSFYPQCVRKQIEVIRFQSQTFQSRFKMDKTEKRNMKMKTLLQVKLFIWRFQKITCNFFNFGPMTFQHHFELCNLMILNKFIYCHFLI